jgi:hypothetical protein
MRTVAALAIFILASACQRTPDQQQADLLRNDAEQRGSAIEDQAEAQANRLEQQAQALEVEAKQTGGLTGERLKVRADALAREAKIIRRQGDMQSDAIKEAADARIKTSESR